MRPADDWFREYGESHQNPTNKTIHWICVPLILLTVLGMLWAAPAPAVKAQASIRRGAREFSATVRRMRPCAQGLTNGAELRVD